MRRTCGPRSTPDARTAFMPRAGSAETVRVRELVARTKDSARPCSIRRGRRSRPALFLGGCTPIARPVPDRPCAPRRARSRRARRRGVLNRANVGVSFYGSVLSWSRADLTNDLDRVRAMGATWVRIPMNWVTLRAAAARVQLGAGRPIVRMRRRGT